MSSATHGKAPYYFVPGPSGFPAAASLGLFFVIPFVVFSIVHTVMNR